MRRILPKTLFGQLVLGTLLVQALLLAVFLSYIVVSSRQTSEERTEQRMEQQLNRLSAACAKRLEAGDMASLHEILELSRIATSIDAARLTDTAGNTLAVSANGRSHGLDAYELTALASASRRQIFKIRNGQLEGVTPVTVQGKPLALLWLEPNHAGSLNTANTLLRIALTYGGFALLANLLPIFLIVRTMTQPLRTLQAATQRVIQNPDLSDDFSLPAIAANEAGDLTVSFNTMVRELREQRSGLLETLALLDSLLAIAPIGFAFFDSDLRCVRVNQYLGDMFEVSLAESPERRATELLAPEMAEKMESCVTQVFETGQAIHNVELSMPASTPDTQRSWLMHFYPVRTQQDTILWVGLTAVEITERLRAEEALRKTEKLAATGRLAASIAHEINNPLEAVTNLLYLLQIHQPMDEAAMSYVLTAQAELARVSEITQQTLRFYRQSTHPSRTNVADLLDSVNKLYQSRIGSAQVSVSRRFRPGAEVFGFNGELRQVFANLVGNALDAMPGGGRLTLRVRRGCGRGQDGSWREGVWISVADTGGGMSNETMRRVFEAFFTTKQATGTGLGLWVTEEIVRKHTGRIRVRSRVGAGSGTCFLVFLPDGAALRADEAEQVGSGMAVAAI